MRTTHYSYNRMRRPLTAFLIGHQCLSTLAFSLHASMADVMHRYDAFILDQFGVLHNGAKALPGAVECVQALYQANKKLIILSNTSAPSSAALQKLPKFGFSAHHFVGAVTSGEEASRYIRSTYGQSPSRALFLTWDESDPNNPRLTATPQQFLAQCGQVTPSSSVEDADFVLAHGSEIWFRQAATTVSLSPFIEQGDLTVVDEILQACRARQLPLVCANPDRIVLAPDGVGVAHMPGTIAARYRDMGGACRIFGKPETEHFEACLNKLGLDKGRVAHVGDSLHHDIAGAAQTGIANVFVTSGIHAGDLGTAFGEMPTKDALRALLEKEAVTPTHVIPAFCL